METFIILLFYKKRVYFFQKDFKVKILSYPIGRIVE